MTTGRAAKKIRWPFSGALAAPAAAACLCACVTSACALQAMADRSEISPDDLEALINRPNTTVTLGTLELGEGDVVKGHVVVIEGDLEMQSGSMIEGDATVVAGDALLNGACVVGGDLRVVSGFLYASDLSEVGGETLLLEGNYTIEEYDETTGKVELKGIKDINRHRFGVGFLPGPFNRVDGHNFDFTLQYKRPEGVPGSTFEGFLRVPTEDTHDNFLQFHAAFSMPFMQERMVFQIEGYKLTDTEDRWRTGDLESSLVAFFTSNDDRDYYERTGGRLVLGYEVTEEIDAAGALSSGEYRSLDERSPFTLFRGTDFRSNPPVFEGHITELELGIVYDTRFDPYFPEDAWLVQAGLRSGLDFLDGEASYNILEATVRRHQKLTHYDLLDLRFKMAGATDPLPPQRTFSLGSFGGLRGKDFDSWASPRGDRLLLANIEYRRRLAPLRFMKSLFSSWWFVAFYDAGALFMSEDPEDFGSLISDAEDHTGSGTGLGVAGSSFLPYVGVFAAKDLDTDSWRFIFRMNRPF